MNARPERVTAARTVGFDVTTPDGIALAHRLEAHGWLALEFVLPLAYARLWVCPDCSGVFLDPVVHLEVDPHGNLAPGLLPAREALQLHTALEWERLERIHIADPDGWRADGLPMDTPITRADFQRRSNQSTTRRYCTQPVDCGHPALHWHDKNGKAYE